MTSRIYYPTIILQLVLIFLPRSSVGQAADQDTKAVRSARRVLFDQSHEFLFVVDHLGRQVHQSGYSVTVSRDTFPPSDLTDFQVVLLHQSSTFVDYDQKSIKAVEEYVKAGGSLFVGFRPNFDWPNTGKRPIERLLAALGINSNVAPGKLPLTVIPINEAEARYRFSGEATEPPIIIAPLANQRQPIRNMRPLVVDAQNQSVALRFDYGKGRVIVTTDHNPFGFLTAGGKTPEQERQAALLLSLYDWLAFTERATQGKERAQHRFEYRQASLVLERNGLVVRYTRPLLTEAQYLLEVYDRFHRTLAELTQTEPLRPLQVETLAGGGGGFAGPGFVGIGVLTGDRKATGRVLLWEMTNAWPLPQAPSMVEAWAVFMVNHLGPRLGVRTLEDVQKARAEMLDLIAADDPDLKKTDVSVLDPQRLAPGRPTKAANWAHFRTVKCGLLLHMLHERFGDDWVRKLVRIHRGLQRDQSSPVTPDFDTFVKEASLAADEDLTDFFRQHGTTVRETGLPKERVALQKMAKEILDAEAQEKEAWQQYKALQEVLADDSWVRDWQIQDNLVGNDHKAAWIDDPRKPPKRFTYLQFGYEPKRFEWGQNRRGFLIIHPREPKTPCRLSREFDVPAEGTTKLHLGAFLRPAGAQVALRVLIGDKTEWERQLGTPVVPIASSVDLTPYAGQKIKLRLEADSRGEWGFREVFLDYLTIRTTPRP